jgi:hypothetical protein
VTSTWAGFVRRSSSTCCEARRPAPVQWGAQPKDRQRSTETALEVRMAVLAVAGAVKTLNEDRNLIVRGTWGELDGVPNVGSLQLETIDRNEVTLESFPPDRLRDFIRDVTACRDQVTAIIAQVESSRRGSS